MNPSPVERLQTLGFRRVGAWRFDGGVLDFDLTEHAEARNVLYAFISSGSVLYIGKTVKSLCDRIKGYRRPGPTQETNKRGNERLRELLAAKAEVEIFALPDNGLLRYGGFHVNLAAGLEDDLIATLKPVWNKAGIGA